MKRLLLLSLLFCHLSTTSYAKEPEGFHATIAFGTLFSFPGAVLIGVNSWEGGQVANGVLGLGKRFFFSENTYTSFGFAYSGFPDPGPGLYGGLGFDWRMFWIVGLRGEAIGYVDTTGSLAARSNLGFSFDF